MERAIIKTKIKDKKETKKEQRKLKNKTKRVHNPGERIGGCVKRVENVG